MKKFGARLYSILPGKEDVWKTWCEELQTTHAEAARQTLRDEGASIEGFVAFWIDGKMFTLGFAEGELLVADQNKELNRLHREKKMACLGTPMDVESLYILKADEEKI